MRKTKIVCTLGPAVDDESILEKLMLAGMNVGRFNFSHGNYEEQLERIERFKKIRDKLNLPIAMMLDTKGPEIRIGCFEQDKAKLEKDNIFILLNEDILGNNEKVSITYKELYKDVEIGQSILINDGTIEVKVIEVKEKDIYCKIINGGTLTNRKSINIPNMILNLPSMTQKDIEDIKFGVTNDFDYIAASFIRKATDVIEIKALLKENGGEQIKIISKIENREGINNFDEILEVSDGIMVARGDLGVEIPMEEVPILQKQFIKKTYRANKPVITATQMLESMIVNPRPTRAEVSDVANAIFDGSSAIMLSGETAMGNYPVECVEAMNKIAISVEESIDYWKRFKRRNYELDKSSYETNINHSVCSTAMNINAKGIFAFTQSGDTPTMISSFAPKASVFALTTNKKLSRQLSLCFNVYPFLFENEVDVNEIIKKGIQKAKDNKYIVKNDMVVISGGVLPICPSDSDCDINRMIGGVLKI